MAKIIEISETKIRQAIWMLKIDKTKKSICEHLGIAYNTKRLDTIINEFREKQERIQELKEKARQKSLTHKEELDIISSYEEGESTSAIAEKLYLAPQNTCFRERNLRYQYRKMTIQPVKGNRNHFTT